MRYTVGIWTVKPGREDEFVEAWRAFGEATLADFPDARGTLLQDTTDASRFISFGPWETQEEVDRWRASPAFQDGVARIRPLLDGFEPGTYELRTELSSSSS
jgi:heme-degrading monooxygenase HmoA